MRSLTEAKVSLHSPIMVRWNVLLLVLLLALCFAASGCEVFGIGETDVHPIGAHPVVTPVGNCTDDQGPPIKVWDCAENEGYQVNSGFTPGAGIPEVHVVGVYESSAPDTYLRTGYADVRVTREGVPIVLVLSAFEPTNWRVTASAGVQLERVVLSGVHDQTADVPAGVELVPTTTTDSCGLFWDSSAQCTEQALASYASLAGAPVTSWAGCYKASAFSIGVADCQEQPEPRRHCDPSCAGLPAGTHTCTTVDFGGDVQAMTFETGTTVVTGNVAVFGEFSSMAIIGDELYTCDEGSGLRQSDLHGGGSTVQPMDCAAVANYLDGLLVLALNPGAPLMYYASFADAVAGNGIAYPIDTFATRIVVHGDTLYTAWHSTFEVEKYSLTTFEHLGTIELEGYNTWIFGLSVTDDGVLFVNGSWPEQRIAAFDEATGAALANFDLDRGMLNGLLCSSAR